MVVPAPLAPSQTTSRLSRMKIEEEPPSDQFVGLGEEELPELSSTVTDDIHNDLPTIGHSPGRGLNQDTGSPRCLCSVVPAPLLHLGRQRRAGGPNQCILSLDERPPSP